jgi:chemotaxis signal transduction protein
MALDNTLSRENSDLPSPDEFALPDLVAHINNEITAALRFDQDDTSGDTGDERINIGRHICIELAGKRLAIPLTSILEAGELQVVQPLPLLPDWLSGITNIRGEIISVVHLGLFLDDTNQSPGDLQSFIVVYDNDITVAITVDRILGTRSLYRYQSEPREIPERIRPVDFFGGSAMYLDNEVEEEVGIFDLKGFLSSDRLHDFTTA